MTKYIHGTHDVEGKELMKDDPGWLVITEALGSDPHDHSGKDYTGLSAQGFGVIVRLNNGYHPVGTIPGSQDYDAFARRCGNFVAASPGITVAIIGNEPNHANERPYGELIPPNQYAKCFDLCYKQIKQKAPHVMVCTAAVAPWDATTTYQGNPNGDWVQYYYDMLYQISKADAICLHTYTHGSDPFLITDESKMNPPFDQHHYNFRAYIDFLAQTPLDFYHLPVFITETDQVEPWANRNIGWVQEAYEEINMWNSVDLNQKIHCLALYRSNWDDQWSFAGKNEVKKDFRQAVQRGYKIPDNIVTEPPYEPDAPTEPDLPITDNEHRIDPTLLLRGVTFEFQKPPRGTGYWKIINAIHLNEEEADAAGPDHHIIGTVMKNATDVPDIPFLVTWPSGKTHVYSKAPQPNINYNYDYPMSSSLNEYSIWVDDGHPSDKAHGIGMGANGNPSIHTSTWIDWQWTISEGVAPPIPPIEPPISPPSSTKLFHPLPQSIITQHFYQNPEDYAKFGLGGHDGTDLAGKLAGTPVLCLADGVVAYAGFDADYGNYIRVEHRQGDLMCCSFYAHLQQIGFTAGFTVAAGQQIGTLGMTGNATGVHLHLEIRLLNADGSYREGTPMPKGRVDPQTFLAERGLRL